MQLRVPTEEAGTLLGLRGRETWDSPPPHASEVEPEKNLTTFPRELVAPYTGCPSPTFPESIFHEKEPPSPSASLHSLILFSVLSLTLSGGGR